MSNRYASAYVTITAKVFVPVDECTDDTFQEIAEDRIHELCRTDDPLKLCEIEIDMDTLKFPSTL